ncbi:MAG: glycerate kinase [Acaryochloris sp. RU_4_1]|nr:glycerate kinase [Acaryochloris sp. RU_4_1]NJR55165.1 glycerate kinase [Acaryochloris sp. CRU_2_0]
MDVLENLAQGKTLTASQQTELSQGMLRDRCWAAAFNWTPETINVVIQEQAQLLSQIYPQIQRFWQEECQIPTSCLQTLWQVWMPLALQLAQARAQQDRPFIQGILGMQGAGKTTLTRVLQLILAQLGYSCCSLSLDDLYKTYAERQKLYAQDPRLKWRGPPGTHDVFLGLQVLDQFRAGDSTTTIQVPRFDKSAFGGQGDRSGFESVPSADILLFEGWFVGAQPIDPGQFAQAPVPIYTAADREFAVDMNRRLQDYLPLWDRLDRLLVLNLTDYRLSKQWRQEAEHKAIATGHTGMSDTEIDQFVDYFWQALHPELFVNPLVTDENGADLVITINADHWIEAVYKPALINPD